MDQELLQEFIIEAVENLDSLDQELLELENNPQSQELVNSIFRRIHTIKGTCGFLELTKLEALTHTGETLLDSLRSGRIPMTEAIITALLEMLDTVRDMLEFIEANACEREEQNESLLADLKRLNEEVEETPVEKEQESAETIEEEVMSEEDELAALFKEAQEEYLKGAEGDTNEKVVENEPVKEVKKVEKNDSVKETKESGNKLAESSLRVDVELVDRLMNLVGELVLTRNQILQFASTSTDSAFSNTTQQLNLITSELQEGVMRTRMQPIGNVWNKFPRIVRDVSKACNKEVQVIMEGEDTELDKTIIAAIKDPLTHIIRNSIDHGIEAPDVREARGKDRQGTILLSAHHEGGSVIIEINDDGGGINTARVRDKAIEKGLYSEDVIEGMSDREIQNLIFHAGFSTAEKLSNISGRGVGMDVVRSNLESIGGNIELQSTEGIGTTLKIKIPLTLAIIPALIVTQADQRFAIPQVDLVELFRLEGNELVTRMEDIHGSVFIRLRGDLLPVVYLGHELNLYSKVSEDVSEDVADFENKNITVVVIKIENKQYGLVIDEVHETQEIVVKPLGRRLKDINLFGGATIMGDGQIALILDTMAIARQANILEDKKSISDDGNLDDEIEGEKTSLVVADVGEKRRIAVELDQVNRLEEFPIESVEYGSGSKVIKYRGGLLKLIDLSEELRLDSKPEDAENPDELKVIVLNESSGLYGLVVDRVVDIVDESVTLQSWENCSGVRGSAVVQGKVTDFIDLNHFLQM